MKASGTTKLNNLLTERQVAEILGKSLAWMQRARWAGGGIPYVKLGRNVRYRESDVLKWIDERADYTSTSQYGEA